jgi:superfamily I DNA/RNA helicase
MPITPKQVQAAQQQQFQVARDTNSRVRLIAGPGTGKSHCIQERVRFLLSQSILPAEIFVRGTINGCVNE